jgi:hypothetical protein
MAINFLNTIESTGSITITKATTDPLLYLYNSTNGSGATIRFSDQTVASQTGDITFYHSDGSSQGGGASWHFVSEPDTVLVVGSSSVSGRFVAKSAGTVGEVDYGFFDDVNTGMYRAGADSLRLVAGGVSGVSVSATGVGLRYAGSTKFETTSTGVTVTGDINQGAMYYQDGGGAGRIGFNRNTTNGVIHDSNYNAFQFNGTNTSGVNGKFELQAYSSGGVYGGSLTFDKTANLSVAGTVTASSFSSSTDAGINISGITLTRVAVNSAIRVSNGLETLGLLRSYAGLNVATTGSFGGIIDMNSNKITELAPGFNNLDAVNYQQLQDAVDGVLVYQGTWNASTNTPTLASGVGTPGYYYIVSTAGSTNLDGITDWLPGDWAIFSDQATDVWQKIDHTNVLNGAGTGNKVTKWSGSGTSYTLTDSILEDNGSELVSAGKIILNNVAGDRKIQFNRTGGNSYSIEQDSASLYFYNTSTSEAPLLFQNDGDVIMNAGNVGIGTTSPSAKLEVAGDTPVIRLTDTRNLNVGDWDDVSLGRIEFKTSDTTTPGARVLSEIEAYSGPAAASGPESQLRFKTSTNSDTSATTKMTIDAQGNVGIGTTSPTNYKLQVNGTVESSAFSVEGASARIFAPSGANYNGGGTQTGYLIAKLPDNAGSGINNMMTGVIRVYDYTSNESFDVHFAGYWYSGYNWINCSAWIDSAAYDDRNFSVRFGKMDGVGTGTRPYIMIGEATSTWTYCKFSVINYEPGHSNYEAYKWDKGWNMDINATNPGTVLVTASNTQTNNWARNSQDLYYGSGSGNVGIGTTNPSSKLQVAGGIQMADDTDTASAAKVGTLKYRVSGNNSYVDMCMQTGAATYEWVNIVQNNW